MINHAQLSSGVFSECRKMDKVETPQDHYARGIPGLSLPDRWRRLRRHWRRPVQPTLRQLCVDTRWQQSELIHFALIG